MNSLEFLRIDSESYSKALGEQIFTENIYLIEHFKNQVYPEIVKRQFSKYGYLGPRKRVSIHLGSLLTLYVFSMLARPKSITEVGTFSGSSGLALAASFLDPEEEYSFYTCDTNECDKTFINSLSLNATVDLKIFRESSMKMFQKLHSRNHRIDLLHLDGFLHPNEPKLISKLLSEEAIILIDDCRVETKGINNVKKLEASGCFDDYFYCAPFRKEQFAHWGYNCSSVTGAMIPKKLLIRVK